MSEAQRFEMPNIEPDPELLDPEFAKKATPVDNRTPEEFQADWETHKEIKQIVSERKPTGWQKMVENYPTEVPESFMTDEEKEKEFGAKPLRKHELN